MAARKLDLAERLRKGTFRARLHHRMLGESADLEFESFAELQQRYRRAEKQEERREIALAFERLMKLTIAEAQRRAMVCDCRGCRQKLEPFTLDHFVAWTTGLTLDTGDPWVVEPFQTEFVEDVFRGFPVCWLVIPEGNTKTTTVAGLALYFAEHSNEAYIPVAASSRDQAEWIYRQAEGFVIRSGRTSVFRCLEGYRRIRCDRRHARIQVFAADDRGGDGIIPAGLAILDELHRHRDLALYRTWMGKLVKRKAQMIVISTAGEAGGEFEAERDKLRQEAKNVIRNGAFTRAEKVVNGKNVAVLHDWAVPTDASLDDINVVKAANPFSGVTAEYLVEKRELPGMTAQHWARFTCNVASRSEAAAITEQEWERARTTVEIPVGEPVWVGLDLGWKWDTTALVPLWWKDHEFRLLGPAVVIEPPRDGSSTHPDLIEDAITNLHERNPIHTVVMDMTAGEQLAHWIEDEIGATVVDRSQTNALAVLDYARFMEGLREGWLHHTGDPNLSQHAMNVISRMLPGGDIRFARAQEARGVRQPQQRTRVIDALIAAAMVHSTAVADYLDAGEVPVMAGWH